MEKLRYTKVALVEKIQVNRDNHRAIFDRAMDGYLVEADKRLREATGQIRAGKVPNFSALVQLPVPVDHTQDYDAVLAMLAMAVDDEIEVEENDFRAYVLDEWRWKGQFIAQASNYTVM